MRLGSGAAALIAGTVAALTPPVLVLGFDQPVGLGLGLGFGLGGALFGMLGLGRGGAGRGLSERRESTAHALLDEGQAALDRLRRAARMIRDPLVVQQLKLLAESAERVFQEARANPEAVMPVRRLFTFYLPNAASVAEGWRALEVKPEPEPALEAQARETMASLNVAFARFADEMHEPKMQALDLDLKVLNSALHQDLEGSR